MKKIEVSELKKGDIVSETQYYQVTGNNVNGITGHNINFINERKFAIQVGVVIVENDMFSANQFTEVIKVTATQLAEIFAKVGDSVFEVSFQKIPQGKDINDMLSTLNGGKFSSNKEIKEAVVKAYKGQERILRGYMCNVDSIMGRARVVDLEVKLAEGSEDPGYRLVDFRHLNYLINRGVKYVVK